MTAQQPNIAFIGFGEAAQAFATGFAQVQVAAAMHGFDSKLLGTEAATKHAEFAKLNVISATDSIDAIKGADVIVSLVTANNAEAAAKQVAQTTLKGAMFFDANSCAPDTKRRAAAHITKAGGRYVDMAIMTPVHPKLHRSPCLLAGPDAQAALKLCQSLGMDAQVAGDQVGAASMRKMLRSIMVKGLEALTLECFTAARKAGVDADIMASLDKSYPGFDWPKRAPYMMERALTHGARRAAEMEEVAQTLRDLGMNPHMAEATADRHRRAGALGLDAAAIGADDLAALSDAILTAASADPEQPI